MEEKEVVEENELDNAPTVTVTVKAVTGIQLIL